MDPPDEDTPKKIWARNERWMGFLDFLVFRLLFIFLLPEVQHAVYTSDSVYKEKAPNSQDTQIQSLLKLFCPINS